MATRCQHCWVLVTCRRPLLPLCALTWPLCTYTHTHTQRERERERAHRERERERERKAVSGVSSSFIRTPVLSDQGPHLQPHLTLMIPLKVLSPNIVTLGVRVSTYEGGRGTQLMYNNGQTYQLIAYLYWVLCEHGMKSYEIQS